MSQVYNRFVNPLDNPVEIKAAIIGSITTPQSYQYQVAASNWNGKTLPTEIVAIVGEVALSDNNYVIVSWEAVDLATEYAIYGRIAGDYSLLGVYSTDDLVRIPPDDNWINGGWAYIDQGQDVPTGENPVAANMTGRNEWDEILFLDDKACQSAEVNEVQEIANFYTKKLGDSLYKEGYVVKGCSPTIIPAPKSKRGAWVLTIEYIKGDVVTSDGQSYIATNGTVHVATNDDKPGVGVNWEDYWVIATVTIDPGEIYLKGKVRAVPGGAVVITGIDKESVGIKLIENVVTHTDDAALLDPAIGTDNYMRDGSARRIYTYEWSSDPVGMIKIYDIFDGEVIVSSQQTSDGRLGEILAQRTFEESGNYVVNNTIALASDISDISVVQVTRAAGPTLEQPVLIDILPKPTVTKISNINYNDVVYTDYTIVNNCIYWSSDATKRPPDNALYSVTLESQNKENVRLSTDAIRAYVQGWRVESIKGQNFDLQKATDTALTEDEQQEATDSKRLYKFFSTSVKDLISLKGNALCGSSIYPYVKITKSPSGTDTLPLTPVVAVIDVMYNGEHYLEGVDFSVNGNSIVWLPTQSGRPAPPDNGNMYDVSFTYRKTLTHATIVKRQARDEIVMTTEDDISLTNKYGIKCFRVYNLADEADPAKDYRENVDFEFWDGQRYNAVTESVVVTRGTGDTDNLGRNSVIDILDVRYLSTVYTRNTDYRLDTESGNLIVWLTATRPPQGMQYNVRLTWGPGVDVIDLAWIRWIPGTGRRSPELGITYVVQYTYWDISSLANDEFLAPDSYTDEYGNSLYDEIPSYGSESMNCYIDFRPTSIMPKHNINYSYNYYLPRRDLAAISTKGEFLVIKGSPSDTPEVPPVPANMMAMFEIYFSSYTFNATGVRILRREVKRATMADIRSIEERVNTIEYYQGVDLLEKQATDVQTSVAKVGIIADPMKGASRADMGYQKGNIRYSVALDTAHAFTQSPTPFITFDLFDSEKTAVDYVTRGSGTTDALATTPVVDIVSVEFNGLVYKKRGTVSSLEEEYFQNGNGVQWVRNAPSLGQIYTVSYLYAYSIVDQAATNALIIGKNIMLPIIDDPGLPTGLGILEVEQPFSSQSVNINPYDVFNWTGTIDLKPESDYWVDTTQVPDLNVQDDKTLQEMQNWQMPSAWEVNATPWETHITGTATTRIGHGGGWFDKRTSSWYSDNVGWNVNSRNWQRRDWGTVNTEWGYTERQVTRVTMVPETSTVDLGDRILDTSVIPKIRPQWIQIRGYKLRPNTDVWCTVDDKAKVLAALGTTKTGADLQSVTTDAAGSFWAQIYMGPGEFSTGERRISISNTIGGHETEASAIFRASGLAQSRQKTYLEIRDLQPKTTTTSETQAFVNQTVTPVKWVDPLAETILFRESMFMTGIGLYFATKDPTIPITVEIRTVENGYPGQDVLTSVTIFANDINVPNPSAGILEPETICQFNEPIFIEGGKEYAVCIMANSTNYNIRIATMGGTDKMTSQLISKQPYGGVLFKSSNASTWVADANSDLKFRIYRAKFAGGAAYICKQIENINSTILCLSSTHILPGDQKNVITSIDYLWTDSSGTPTEPLMNFETSYLGYQIDNITVGAYLRTNNDRYSPVIHSERMGIVTSWFATSSKNIPDWTLGNWYPACYHVIYQTNHYLSLISNFATDDTKPVVIGNEFWKPLPITAWVADEWYNPTDVVTHGLETTYTCISGHTSSALTEPLVGDNWRDYWIINSENYDNAFHYIMSNVNVRPGVLDTTSFGKLLFDYEATNTLFANAEIKPFYSTDNGISWQPFLILDGTTVIDPYWTEYRYSVEFEDPCPYQYRLRIDIVNPSPVDTPRIRKTRGIAQLAATRDFARSIMAFLEEE